MSITALSALVATLTLAAPGADEGPAGGGTSQENAIATVPAGIVDGPTARRLLAAGAVVIDVRTAREFASGHVPEAKNIPHDEIAARAPEIGPPQTPVVVYCSSGRRSAIAAAELKRLGYSRIWDVRSYARWREH